MTRFAELTARLQSMRRDGSSTGESSDDDMRSISSATETADAAVRKYEVQLAAGRVKNGIGSSSTSDDVDGYVGLTRAFPPSNIPFAPRPTIKLPPNYPFRTTETGYPIFKDSKLLNINRSGHRRATMASETGFADPRITAFVDHYTKFYTEMGKQPDGLTELRLACDMRNLVTYGTSDKLVLRLVERALRDAARGWSEIADSVGRIRREAPPPLLTAAYDDTDAKMEDSP